MKYLLKQFSVGLFMLVFLSSCAYHCGNRMPEEIRAGGVALGQVENMSKESVLTMHIKNAFNSCMSKTPGMKLASQNAADYVVDIRINSMKTNSVISAKIREDVDDDYEDTEYQSILHSEVVEVEYRLHKVSEPGNILLKGTVEGKALIPSLHDREVMLRSSNEHAASDAAQKIVQALTEDWL